MSYTPGPWRIKYLFNVFSGERLVASCGGHSSNENPEKVHSENVANARLVSQAPSMLTVLKELTEACQDLMIVTNADTVRYADKTIAKAKAIIRAAEGGE